MKKPDDIPQDVWELSEIALQNWLRYQGPTTREGFAHTIMDERERCAKLIENGFTKVVGESYAGTPNVRSKHDKCPHGRYMYEDCDQCCADAIREGRQP